MRGKDDLYNEGGEGYGITPAYAGKSSALPLRSRTSRDHPRLCGEKMVGLLSQSPEAGSPPPMRGKVPVQILRAAHRWITPAYAGKSHCRKSTAQ